MFLFGKQKTPQGSKDQSTNILALLPFSSTFTEKKKKKTTKKRQKIDEEIDRNNCK